MNHVHEFDSREDCLRRAKRLGAKDRPGDAFDGLMILLHGIVEVLALPDIEKNFSLRIHLVKCRLISGHLE